MPTLREGFSAVDAWKYGMRKSDVSSSWRPADLASDSAARVHLDVNRQSHHKPRARSRERLFKQVPLPTHTRTSNPVEPRIARGTMSKGECRSNDVRRVAEISEIRRLDRSVGDSMISVLEFPE